MKHFKHQSKNGMGGLLMKQSGPLRPPKKKRGFFTEIFSNADGLLSLRIAMIAYALLCICLILYLIAPRL